MDTRVISVDERPRPSNTSSIVLLFVGKRDVRQEQLAAWILNPIKRRSGFGQPRLVVEVGGLKVTKPEGAKNPTTRINGTAVTVLCH